MTERIHPNQAKILDTPELIQIERLLRMQVIPDAQQHILNMQRSHVVVQREIKARKSDAASD